MLDVHHIGILASKDGIDKLLPLLDIDTTSIKQLYIDQFSCNCILVGNIEFVIPDSGPLLHWWEANQQHGVCMHHVAINVEDINQAAKRYIQLGYRMVSEQPVPGVGNTLVNFVHPVDVGIMIELVQQL